jgi:hypothetical protein
MTIYSVREQEANINPAHKGDEVTSFKRPASVYVNIPDWLEAEIKALDADDITSLISDLAQSLWLLSWLSDPTASISEEANKWLRSQSRDTFKALLQWVSMELI